MTRLSKLGFINTTRTAEPVRRRIRSRGVPEALSRHEVFCTDHVAVAEELAGYLLGPHRLTVEHGDDPFQASLHAVRLRDVTMAHLDYHHAAHLDFSATGDHYSVLMPTSGQASARYNGTEVTGLTYQALVINPRTKLSINLAFDSPLLIIRIEVQALEHQLSQMLGRSVDRPVIFDPEMILTTDPAVRWHGSLQLFSSEVMTPESLVQQGIGTGPIEELLISSLLWVQPSNVHDQLAEQADNSGRASVRDAVSYIEAHLADAITLPEIARHANRSPRSIQQAFAADLKTTPMNYVRDRRLERVRAQLAVALPSDGVTVTDVAERWGFHHLGNFSAAYRKRFGETPSQTLRR